MSVVALAVMAALSLALLSTSGTELTNADSYSSIVGAQVCAEDGIAFLTTECIPTVRLPYNVTDSDILTGLKLALTATDANGSYTNNLARNLSAQGTTVSFPVVNNMLVSPTLTMPNGTFVCRFAPGGTDTDGTPLLKLYATGTSNSVTRSLVLTFRAEPYINPVFDYGIASKGRISVKGNASITGNPSSTASVLSIADTASAIEVGGSAVIDGELYVTSDSELAVSATGSPTVAGETSTSAILNDHTHYGVDDPEFPVVDTTPFASMYQNDITSQADIDDQADVTADFDGDGTTETRKVFENIRIVANASQSNKALDFKNDAIINGVVYVEYPNWIVFHSSVTINGIIVSDNTHVDGQTLGSVEFRGQSSLPGPSALPDDPKWDAIKEFEGTSILIPGFDLSFRGATFAMNGMIAAEVISFRGNTDINGSLPGPIMGLGDYAIVVGEEVIEDDDMTTTIQGNINITLTARDEDEVPGGFKSNRYLVPVPSTYDEVILDAGQ
jgi:hypothetical protein